MSIIWIPLLLTFLFVSCTAFGNFAHRLIGMLVWDRLDNCTKSALWKIIPRNRSLASLACYADTIKHESGMEWTQPLHFIDPYDDPPFYCGGVYSLTEPNVISAALNYTLQINRDWQHFAFAIHFLMDLHMPLHRKYPSGCHAIVVLL